MSRLSRRILCGRIGAPHGVKGWLKLQAFTDPADRLVDYQPWYYTADGADAIRVDSVQSYKSGLIAQLEGIDDRDSARSLTHREIWVDRAVLPAAEDNEYYWQDLEGCEVVRESGTIVGKVSYLLDAGAHDVLVIQGDKQEVLIPFVVGDTVVRVDLGASRITVNWDWE